MSDRLSAVRQRMSDGAAAARQAVAGSQHASATQAWVVDTLARVPLPSVPAAEPWALSVADLVGRAAVVPGPARKLLTLLDCFGCVRVGPDGLGFDGTDVSWRDVEELRVAPLVQLLTTTALEKEVDRLRRLLPPVPGRKWVLGQALRALQGLLARATTTSDGRSGTGAVCSVRYNGRFGRPRELHPGLAAVLVLAALPQVNDSLLATARGHGVVVNGATGAQAVDPVGERARLDELAAHLDVVAGAPEDEAGEHATQS